jgi:RNA polymerase sigma-70 factor (sigma-E family)
MAGDVDAEFSELVFSRWPRLVRLAYGLTGDPGLAEDLAQTALANAYASWSRVRRSNDPDRYLTKILLNAHRGGFRKRRVHEQLTDAVPDRGRDDPFSGHPDRAAIITALSALPARQREAVVLRYWLDYTETQAAHALGCSVGNVKSQVSRALAKLRVSPDLADWGSQ